MQFLAHILIITRFLLLYLPYPCACVTRSLASPPLALNASVPPTSPVIIYPIECSRHAAFPPPRDDRCLDFITRLRTRTFMFITKKYGFMQGDEPQSQKLPFEYDVHGCSLELSNIDGGMDEVETLRLFDYATQLERVRQICIVQMGRRYGYTKVGRRGHFYLFLHWENDNISVGNKMDTDVSKTVKRR